MLAASGMSARSAAPEGGTSGQRLIDGIGHSIAHTIAITIPPRADSPFLFRRAFLAAIRKAVSEAQIRGDISAIAVECNRALPITDAL